MTFAIVIAAISSVSDLLYIKNDDISFDGNEPIAVSSAASGVLAGRDLAWICDGVAERLIAQRAASSVTSYVPYSRQDSVSGTPIKLNRYEYTIGEEIAGRNGSQWFKRSCADPNGQVYGEYDENWPGTDDEFAAKVLGMNYCTNDVFKTNLNIAVCHPVENAVILCCYTNLRHSTRFFGTKFTLQSGGLLVFSESGNASRFPTNTSITCHEAVGKYATDDVTKNDWEWGVRKSFRYLGPDVVVRDVPRGATVHLMATARYRISGWIVNSDGTYTRPSPQVSSGVKFWGVEHKPCSTGSAVADVVFASSDFSSYIGSSMCSMLDYASLAKYNVSQPNGSYESKEYHMVSGIRVLCPRKEVACTCESISFMVVIDLGDHTKWW